MAKARALIGEWPDGLNSTWDTLEADNSSEKVQIAQKLRHQVASMHREFPIFGLEHESAVGMAAVVGGHDKKVMIGWVKPEGGALHAFKANATGVGGLELHFAYVASRVLEAGEDETQFTLTDLSELNQVFGLAENPFRKLQRHRINMAIKPIMADLQALGGEAQSYLNKLASVMVQTEAATFAPAAAGLQGVDLAAFHHVGMTSSFSHNDYEFYAAPGEKGQLRREAVDNFPLLKGILPRQLMMQTVVEAREPLGAFVGQRLGVGKGAIKRLNKIRWDIGHREPEDVLDTLTKMDPNWVPTKEADWAPFLECTDVIKRTFGPVVQTDMAKLLKGKPAEWRAYSVAMRKSAGIVDERGKVDPATIGDGGLNEVAMTINDVVSNFSDRVVLPVAMIGAYGNRPEPLSIQQSLDLAKTSSQLLFQNLNATSVMDRIRRFHHHRIRLTGSAAAEVSYKDPSAEWPPLCEDVVAPNGWRLVNLASAQDLRIEGEELQHCVGGYARGCAEGRNRIIGVRTPEGNHHSTMQVVGFMTDTAECVQHRQRRNNSPDPEARVAEDWFMGQLNSGALQVNRPEIQQHGEFMKSWSATDNLRARAGYNWKDLNAVNNAIREWQEFTKIDSIDKMLTDKVLNKLVLSLNPYSDIASNLHRVEGLNHTAVLLQP